MRLARKPERLEPQSSRLRVDGDTAVLPQGIGVEGCSVVPHGGVAYGKIMACSLLYISWGAALVRVRASSLAREYSSKAVVPKIRRCSSSRSTDGCRIVGLHGL